MTFASDPLYGRCPRCKRIYLVISAGDARRHGHGWTTERQIAAWSACPRDGVPTLVFTPMTIEQVRLTVPEAATTQVVVAPDDWIARAREGIVGEDR
jgi:hypothetical protein